jgi:hypothetical protein
MLCPLYPDHPHQIHHLLSAVISVISGSERSGHPLCSLPRIRVAEDLVQVMLQVPQIIPGNELQRHRFAIVHIAQVVQ